MRDSNLNHSSNLFGQTRGALLACFFGHADQSFYVRQLVREIGGGHGAIQRELKRLADLGLLVKRMQGNQVLYQANSESPVFFEIKSLIAKTVGAHDAIGSALAPLSQAIKIAFIYGSVARQTERANSDVDLMVIGNIPFGDVVTALSPVQKMLNREINPAIFPVSEFKSKLKSGNHFLRGVIAEKKIFILGTEHDLKKLKP